MLSERSRNSDGHDQGVLEKLNALRAWQEALGVLLVSRQAHIYTLNKLAKRHTTIEAFLRGMNGQTNLAKTLLADLINNAQLRNNAFKLEKEFFDMNLVVKEAFNVVIE